MTTIKIVPQEDGTFAVVTRYRGGHAECEVFEDANEAAAYRDAEAERIGATPLYWHDGSRQYMTVPTT